MAICTYSEFRTHFTSRVQSPGFGSGPRSDPLVARRIRKLGLKSVLLADSLLGAVHRIATRYAQLEEERHEVKVTGQDLRRARAQVRNAEEALRSIGRKLQRLEGGLRRYQSAEDQQRFYHIAELVNDLACDLKERAEDLTSSMHPLIRQANWATSKWKHLINLYDYKLRSTAQKITDQWLWLQMDRLLAAKLKSIRGAHLPKSSRYSIISALLQDVGAGWFEPGTIKRYIFELEKKQPKNTATPHPS